MTKQWRSEITVPVQINLDLHEPMNFAEWVNEITSQVPEQYRKNMTIDDWWDRSGDGEGERMVSVSYRRLETDDEVQARVNRKPKFLPWSKERAAS